MHDASFDHQYSLRSFDFIILKWRIRNEWFCDDSLQFHKFLIIKSQNALVIHFYKSNDFIVFDSNRFKKFSNHRKCVVFSRRSIDKFHFDSKTDKMIDLTIIVVSFIHRDEIVVDTTQRIIDRFFLFDRRDIISCVLIKTHVSHRLIVDAESRSFILILSIIIIINSYSLWHRLETTHAKDTIYFTERKILKRKKNSSTLIQSSSRSSSDVTSFKSRVNDVFDSFIRCYF